MFSLPVSSQVLQGRFYSKKDSYMVGEPVMFDVEIKNTGTEVVYLNAKGPGKCLDTYEFVVAGNGAGCGASWVPACAGETKKLLPGESDHGEWPLNSWYVFNHPGKYEVSATRHIPVRYANGKFDNFTFSSKFEVTLEPVDPARVQNILQRFEQDLHSGDPAVRHAALDVLASTAPSYFQDVALRLARGKDAFAAFHAVAALGRMNTPETRAAVADVLTSDQPRDDDEVVLRIRALEALGRSGDPGYATLVGGFMEDKQENIRVAAMIGSAELEKAQAVPQLDRFLFSPVPVIRKNAAQALRYSLTPEAVDPLIGLLTDKDAEVREEALTSLKALTGRSVNNAEALPPPEQQNDWRNWWEANKTKITLPDKVEFFCHM
ncbi:MAG TPA: HEAT repeat domain-containing protein [Terriglobales bacterium]|nr:HEAT repeat domain-containing protein [Terriglobales bacterium]